MPIYEFKCPIHGIFERILPVNHGADGSSCSIDKNCIEECEKIWSIPAATFPKDDGKGLVYFENAKGHIEFSSIADKDTWQPEGYVKKEARNLHERELVEKKLRKQDDSRLAEQFEKRDMQRHYSESVRHSDIRNMMNQGVFNERSKELLKKGIERTIKRPRKRKESELRLSINHESASTIRNKK